MSTANIKLPSEEVEKLKEITGEATGQKAVEKALVYFMRSVRQKKIIDVIQSITFDDKYDVSKVRKRER